MDPEYRAIIYQTEGWFMSLCPELPGVTGQGRSRDECLESLEKAIREATDTPGSGRDVVVEDTEILVKPQDDELGQSEI